MRFYPVFTLWLVVLAGLAPVVLAGGAVPVAELLAGRTAHLESGEATRLAFHRADGAMAMESPGAAPPVAGRWWVDGEGRYCYALDGHDARRCFHASMNASQLQLRDIDDGTLIVVARLEPGDVNGLMADEGAGQPPCDCRLTSHRRGPDRVR